MNLLESTFSKVDLVSPYLFTVKFIRYVLTKLGEIIFIYVSPGICIRIEIVQIETEKIVFHESFGKTN